MVTAQLLQHFDVAAHFIFVLTENDRRLVRHHAVLEGLKQTLIEAMPAERAAGLDDFLERSVLTFAVEQRLARAQARAHDLAHEQSSAADFRNETLTDDKSQRIG